MEPPSYDEARRHPPALVSETLHILPPPSYDASLSSPSTPPPTYGEAVTIRPDPFPVLTPPMVPAAVTSPSQNTGITVHPPVQVGVTQPISIVWTEPVTVTQPAPVPVSLSCLRDIPAVVHCQYCHNVVTTKVTYVPGRGAWCMCLLLTLMGLVCGFCLIPFMVRSLQDAHHSCPVCGNHLFIYTR